MKNAKLPITLRTLQCHKKFLSFLLIKSDNYTVRLIGDEKEKKLMYRIERI